jgi:hypothetical protein
MTVNGTNEYKCRNKWIIIINFIILQQKYHDLRAKDKVYNKKRQALRVVNFNIHPTSYEEN